jgi:predicted nucleic acid-binding protein
MKDHNLDHEDALHLAVAKRKGAQEITSKDIDFDRTPLKRTI